MSTVRASCTHRDRAQQGGDDGRVACGPPVSFQPDMERAIRDRLKPHGNFKAALTVEGVTVKGVSIMQ